MRRYIAVLGLLLTIVACKDKGNAFLISNDQVGVLKKDTRIAQLDSIFAKDSVVSSSLEGELRYASAERITILGKDGKELLEITPTQDEEGEKKVESVLVLCDQYATAEGISLKSTFKDIKAKYPNLKIDPSLMSIIITPKGKNFYFTMDRSSVRDAGFDLAEEINVEDIDETAKPVRITVNF